MASFRRAPGPKPVCEALSEPATQPKQRAVARSKLSARYPAHILFAREYLTPLVKSTDPYLSNAYLEAFNIKHYGLDLGTGATLDLKSGDPVPGSKPFTRLFPYETMRDIIETKKPWIHHFPNGNQFDRFLSWDNNLDDWWHAFGIGEHLSMYLEEDGLDVDLVPPILTSGWTEVIPPSFYKLSRQDDLVKWSVMHLWQRETEPHRVCVLADRTPIRDDMISVPEMRAIITLSGTRAEDEGQSHRTTVPVTVISAAGKQLRVVVGVVDSKNQSVEVRTSRVIDVTDGERNHWEDWLTVLCWIIGEPIGATT